jgi:gluconokinase
MGSRQAGLVVVMGVAGSGKSTLAAPLASRLGWTFLEADDFHPPLNVERIRSGIPLSDGDRLPWLVALRDRIRQELRSGRGVVLACSALKASYRDILADHEETTEFVFLDPDRDTVHRRLSERTGHFAGTSILPSQLAALERPEGALVVEGCSAIEHILSTVEAHLSRMAERSRPIGEIPPTAPLRSPPETR